jgi:hypothetical protein
MAVMEETRFKVIREQQFVEVTDWTGTGDDARFRIVMHDGSVFPGDGLRLTVHQVRHSKIDCIEENERWLKSLIRDPGRAVDLHGAVPTKENMDNLQDRHFRETT